MSTLKPGLFLLIIPIIANLIAGFYVGFHTEFDVTLKVMLSMFVFPTPYLILAIASAIIFHGKHWPPIAYTFNLGALVLSILWFVDNIVLIDEKLSLGPALEQALLNNFYISIGVSLIFIVVIYIEGQIAWPAKNSST